MSFEHPGPRALNYQPCHYGAARLVFRGPAKPMEMPYILCFGGTETFGKFISRPYPDLVESRTGLPTVNMGSVNAGVDAILAEPDMIEAANAALAVVIQVMGAHTSSNRLYSVHPRRNDRFLKATPTLQALYPDIDFTDFSFTGHLLTSLQDRSPRVFPAVVQELQATWMRRMTLLLSKIEAPTILLWMGEVEPASETATQCDIRMPGGPLFVTADMIRKIGSKATHYVEVVSSQEAKASGTRGMTYSELEAVAASTLPGPRTHEEVADALSEALVPYGVQIALQARKDGAPEH